MFQFLKGEPSHKHPGIFGTLNFVPMKFGIFTAPQGMKLVFHQKTMSQTFPN